MLRISVVQLKGGHPWADGSHGKLMDNQSVENLRIGRTISYTVMLGLITYASKSRLLRNTWGAQRCQR